MSLDTANLQLRLKSALILAPVVLLLAYIGGVLYAAAVLLCVMLAMQEWLTLVSIPQLHVKVVAFVLLFAITASALRPSPVMIVTFLIFLGLDLFLWTMQDDFNREAAIGLLPGFLCLAAGGFSLVWLRAIPDHGRALSFFLLAVVWGTDIGAYAAGNLIGGPKLAPLISPKKTWAGLIGGIALAAISGLIVAEIFGMGRPFMAIILSLILAGVAQASDLGKSIFKRRAGVKDSGQLIPGHGGMIDRIDGLVAAAVVLALFEAVLGKSAGW